MGRKPKDDKIIIRVAGRKPKHLRLSPEAISTIVDQLEIIARQRLNMQAKDYSNERENTRLQTVQC